MIRHDQKQQILNSYLLEEGAIIVTVDKPDFSFIEAVSKGQPLTFLFGSLMEK